MWRFLVNILIQWHSILTTILVNVGKDIPKSHIYSLEIDAVVELKVQEAALRQGGRGLIDGENYGNILLPK